jgi:hypothetical protein
MIQPTAGLAGTATSPITVKALNDGAVFIDGQEARIPVHLSSNPHFILEGFDAGNSSDEVIQIYNTNDNSCRRSTCGPVVLVRRVVAFDSPDGSNGNTATICAVQYSDNVTLEDVACFGHGRKAAYSYRNRETTWRRVFVGWGGGGIDTQQPQEALNTSYDAYMPLAENVIGIWNRDSTSIAYRQPYGIVTAGQLLHDTGSPYWATYGRVVSTRILGTISIIRNSFDAQPQGGMWVGGGSNFSDVQDIVFQDVVSYIQTGGSHDSIKPFLLSSYSGSGPANRFLTRATAIGAASDTIGSGWTQTQVNHWTSPASVNIFTGSNQATVCYRYVNGTLTTQKLWPWPMDDRIAAAAARPSSHHTPTQLFDGFRSVTGLIEGIFGTIPAQCKN